MTGPGTTTTLGEVLAVLEAAQDAGRDVGESIRILRQLVTENPGSEWCRCGHVEESPPPSPAQPGLRAVQVRQVPAGLYNAVIRRRRDAREVRQLRHHVALLTAAIAMHDVKLDDNFAWYREQFVRVGVGPDRRHG